ncbi:MAG: hypothetical protein JNN08_07615 [Bryobacterales bacterium]|nr:hypothetical protein [Bryobacterales bacterium]
MSDSFYQTANLNPDGTRIDNPVLRSEPETVDSVSYVIRKLATSSSIVFDSQSFDVVSAVPERMEIGSAYKNTALYYDSASLKDLDFSAPVKLNDGQPSTLESATQTIVTGSGEQVFVTRPKSGEGIFIPYLPNTAPGRHDGLTEHVYWTVDPYIGRAGFEPSGPVYHLAGYGWALDARGVNQGVFVQQLREDGGSVSGGPVVVEEAAIPFNYWKHLISRAGDTTFHSKIAAAIPAGYPFPTGWLDKGVYLPVQPMPGFQRNLIRFYTAWGAWNLLNNTSGLFVRSDGSVELPAVPTGDGNGTMRAVPVVSQTWDGSQRFTVLNQTSKTVPSTYDLYPGNEVYFAANVYLPGKAGVLTSYIDYGIFDGTGTLNPRQTDLWLGLLGDKAEDVMLWADANNTEPGGQANKPYMMGADTSVRNGVRAHNCRLQHSNSFLIARQHLKGLDGKLYAASLYVAPEGGGYELVAKLSYTREHWEIDPGSAHWTVASDGMETAVPVVTVLKNVPEVVVKTSTVAAFSGHAISWNERPFSAGDANSLGKSPQIYTVSAVTESDDVRFLIVLTEA